MAKESKPLYVNGEDKEWLRKKALKENTTIKRLIQQMIEENDKKRRKQKRRERYSMGEFKFKL